MLITCEVNLYHDRPLFNVATSRAKQLTIIVADNAIMNTSCHKDVYSYLIGVTSGIIPEKKDDKPIELDERIIEGNGISLHLKGKIDLSKFETTKQKSVKSDTKKNIYIIDTNVFVNCPDIISKTDDKYQIVMSAKVIDELDKLKIKLN